VALVDDLDLVAVDRLLVKTTNHQLGRGDPAVKRMLFSMTCSRVLTRPPWNGSVASPSLETCHAQEGGALCIRINRGLDR